MKDKTLYWILGIIGAYFVVRFIMNQIAGSQQKEQVAGTTTGYTDKKGFYHYGGHVEGEEAGVCRECGSKTYYRKSLSLANPRDGFILRAVCSNPDCKTHSLNY